MIPPSPRQKNEHAIIEHSYDDSPPPASPIERIPAWQRALGNAIRDGDELRALLGLAASNMSDAGFPVRVPRGYAARMRPGDPHDPLLAQVLPEAAESIEADGFGTDPVGDQQAMPRPGVLHKYHGRVLLVTTGACGIHCRYCFRREFPYAEANARSQDWQPALDYIANDDTIEEVILSGGDPLSLGDARLADLVTRIEAIPHVSTLRLHTRMPVVLPERIDASLCDWLGNTRLATVVVLHANHGNELDAAVGKAVERLHATGATVLNQSVLLRGVNDSADALVCLSHKLFSQRVLPYYLHLLDPVRGASGFAVEKTEARAIMADVATRLPGYLVPRLVTEQAGLPGKQPVPHGWALQQDTLTRTR